MTPSVDKAARDRRLPATSNRSGWVCQFWRGISLVALVTLLASCVHEDESLADGQHANTVDPAVRSSAEQAPEDESYHQGTPGEGRRDGMSEQDRIGTSVADAPTHLRPVQHGTDLTRSHVGLAGIAVRDLEPSGPIVTSRDGQVIEGLDIEVSGRDNWAVEIRHDDVVVRNNRIRHPNGGQGVTAVRGTTGALIEHNVFDAVYLSSIRQGHTSTNNNIGQRTAQIWGADHTMRRNHVLFARSGFSVPGENALISENYIEPLAHRLGVSPTTGTPNSPDGARLHGTGISNAGPSTGWTAERNVVPQGQSGGIVIYTQNGSHQDLSIIDNYFYGTGKGFAIYGGRSHNSTHYNQNRNIKIEGNRFSGTFGFPNTQGRGTNAAVDLSRPGSTFTNNRFIGENTDLPERCGIDSDTCE